MDDLLKWLSGTDYVPGSARDVYWSYVTIALSVLIAIGYGVIAFNRYFQAKMLGKAGTAAAKRRLLIITICSIVCGMAFYFYDMPWPIWRVYDGVLLVLLCMTWWFAIKMRGVGLVDDRLSQMAALEQSVQRYREIAEYLPQMVWTAKESGEIDFSNKKWIEFVGVEKTWLDAIHPEDLHRVEAWWAKALRMRRTTAVEARLGTPGKYRTFLISATPVVNESGVKWLGACADIEAQKLLAAAREMQAKRRAFMLNALSHDLRAPLNTVALNAALLKTVPPEQVRSCAETIVESAKSAGEYVTKLLNFARAGGEEKNNLEQVSVLGVFHQVARRFGPAAQRKGLYMRLDHEGDVEMKTDRQKLERIIGNLVDNAVKYTAAGGVTLGLSPDDDYIAIRITDTGIGVPKESAPYLFDEFYQVNNQQRDGSSGFGIGLAICKCLANQLAGTVTLVSTGPEGSCFEVTLPKVCPVDGGAQALEETLQRALMELTTAPG
jgi:PAS domain S-box-containing protein